MVRVCAECGHDLRPNARFCDSCGASVGEEGATDPPPPTTVAETGVDLAEGASIGDGRFVVESYLGEGANKKVYLAVDRNTERKVALALVKIEGMDESDLRRVQRESQAMADLSHHPNVVSILDIGEESGRPYLVTEYLEGGDVEALIDHEEGNRLTLERVIEIGLDVCAGLRAAHEIGIIHRDLKPGNIWLSADGTAKLGDFGLATMVDKSRVTTTGTILGTAAYMPPEIAMGGGRQADARSDLYSLGATLYDMLAGAPPFEGAMESVISQHINTPPTPLSRVNAEVPKALEAVVQSLLEKSPESRPQDAGDVARILIAISQALSAGGGDGAGAPSIEDEVSGADLLTTRSFVGREQELATLRAGVEEAVSGAGNLVLVMGEPGIGKTNLVEEVATYAELRGMRLLSGQCLEAEGAPSFWPWVQILRAHLKGPDSAAMIDAMGAGAVHISHILPEVRDAIPTLDDLPPLDPEEARFRLFDSINTYLARASATKPLLLFLDDLHWADKPSLSLLQFVARHLAETRVLVVGTYRDVELGRHHPLAAILGEIAREKNSKRISLKGLNEPDVARFIETKSGKSPSESLVATVYRETEGNPFFVNEIVSLLADEGKLDQPETSGRWSIAVPQGVRDVVGRRLDRLSESCNAALTHASVIGRQFDLSILSRVIDVSSDDLLDELDEALGTGILDEDGEVIGRYRFSHALIRETLYDEISVGRRVQLHRTVVAALEASYPSSLDSHLSELAFHAAQAAPGGDASVAIDYATRAADQSISMLAYEDAVAHLETALQLADLDPTSTADSKCDLLLELAEAQRMAGNTAAAKEAAERAADEARTLDDGERLARAALAYGGIWGELGVRNEKILSLLHESLELLGEDDSKIRARVLGRLGVEYGTGALDEDFAGVEARRIELSQAAIDMAERVGDDLALANGLIARQYAYAGPDRVADRLESAKKIVELGTATGDRDVAQQGYIWKMLGYLETGDIDSLIRELSAYSSRTSELKQPFYLWQTALIQTMIDIMQGRFDEAEAGVQNALMTGQQGGFQNATQLFGAQMVALRREQGRVKELEPVIRGFVQQFPTVDAWRAALSYVLAESGATDEARDELTRLGDSNFALLPFDFNWLVAMTLLVQSAYILGEARFAEEMCIALEPFSEQVSVLGPAVVAGGCVAREVGLAATLASNWEKAETAFETALKVNARLGALPMIAHVKAEYADMLTRRGEGGDADRARTLAAEAATQYRELHMEEHAARSEAIVAAVTD